MEQRLGFRFAHALLALSLFSLGASNMALAEETAAATNWDYAFVDGDAERGATKVAACGACHGANGNSAIADNPKLAGQNAGYLAKQLQFFKNGDRVNPIMQGMVASLSEQDMNDIAVYYESQKVAVGAADEDKVVLGEQVYRGGNKETGVPACTGCHGPSGEGNPGANYPALTGQHADYVAKQLLAYRKEQRTNPMANIMMGVAQHMSDKEIEAVSSYIEGLH